MANLLLSLGVSEEGCEDQCFWVIRLCITPWNIYVFI
jgi:hypothetical protein